MKRSMTRREFLKGSIAGTGLIIGIGFMPSGPKLINALAGNQGLSSSFQPNAFVEITPDNIITIWVGQTELGQGSHTALPMLIAEELEADWKQIRVRQAPAADAHKDPFYGMQITGGSTSVRHRFELLRKAGSAAREMLVQAAAETWEVPSAECRAALGRVTHKKSSKTLNYGELSQRAANLPVPQDPPLKDRGRFKIIGTSPARLDIPEKVSGKAIFGMDVSVPDMCVAAVSHPPGYGRSALSYDEPAARRIPGVLEVMPITSGIAVCAKTTEAALAGQDVLNIKWDHGLHPNLDSESIERLYHEQLNRTGVVARNDGDINLALTQADKRLEATYVLPYLAHATMEPMNCTAHIGKDRCTIWTPTQFQTAVQLAGSKISGLPPEKVDVQTTYCGGGFGRRAETTVVVEALELSKALKRPVKVIWTREEDFRNDFYRPGNICHIKGGLDEKGLLIAWSHKIAVSSIMSRVFPQMVKDGIDSTGVEGIVDMDYELPNIHVEYVMMEAPIPVGFWRSVGNTHNAFTVESFIDELAHLGGKDPLEFRLAMVKKNTRPYRVLERLAEKSGWGKPLPNGLGRGMAIRTCFGSTAGHVAEVSVDKKTGEIKVHRIVCAVDCGPAVDPHNIVAQMQGGCIFALSAALKEEVRFAKGGVSSSNYDDYPILTMSETPKIEVHIVKSNDKIGGIGEPGVPPVAPAVANPCSMPQGFE